MCFWQLCLMSVLCVCGINVFQKILEQNRIFMEMFVITGNKNLWISGCCLRSLFVIYASQKEQANHFYCYCYYFLIVKCKPQKAPSNSRTITGRKCCAVFFVLFFHDHCFFFVCLFILVFFSLLKHCGGKCSLLATSFVRNIFWTPCQQQNGVLTLEKCNISVPVEF